MTRTIPHVYIAGPYTARTVIGEGLPLVGNWLVRRAVRGNIARAVDLGVLVAGLGLYPVIPHANTSDARFEKAQGYQFWIATTLELMRGCDVVLTVDGWELSSGALGEVAEARRIGIPVFHSVNELAAAWGPRSIRGAA